jgi:hypothetical protein
MRCSLANQVVFVTSFQPDMYHATGIHLIESFLAHCSDSKMLICTEKFDGEPLNAKDIRLRVHDITREPLLLEWLVENADIIPRHLGGLVDPCNCPVVGLGIEETHRPGCNNFWYNRNASRWFRKVVALKVAARQYPKNLLIWLDSDCRFKRHLSSGTAASWFSESTIFYFKSSERKVVDSGILGMDLSRGGIEFLDDVFDRYTSGKFRQDRRWDDGYQIQTVVDLRKDINMIDLAHSASSHWRGEVIATSIVGKYLDHYKGVHGSALRLMT